MNRLEAVIRRLDRFQQRHVILAFPYAVMQKYGNDQAGGKAVITAYYGFFAVFPLLLLFTTVLGFLLSGNRHFEQQVLGSALANFPILGAQLRSVDHPLTGSTFAVVVGVLGTVYGALGVGQAALDAMHTVWNIPYVSWPNFWFRRLRGAVILAILGLATVLATALAAFGPAFLPGPLSTVWSITASVVVNFGVFTAAFVLLTSEPLGWRDVLVGAGLATVFWEVLQAVGGIYIRHVLAHATPTYGFFAIVIGLLSWLFIGAQLTLLAAEINVVRRYRLWPRSITQPPLTVGDRRTFARLALMQVRRPEMRVAASFTPDANRQPLDALRRKSKTHVTVVGAGDLADVIARRLRAGGAQVDLRGAGERLDGEVIALATGVQAALDLAESRARDMAGKLVVDLTNPAERDGFDPVGGGASVAEKLAGRIPDASVVKAFSPTLLERRVACEATSAPLDVFIAGDDEAAKARVCELVRAGGMRVIDEGPLRRARQLEQIEQLRTALADRLDTAYRSATRIVVP